MYTLFLKIQYTYELVWKKERKNISDLDIKNGGMQTK